MQGREEIEWTVDLARNSGQTRARASVMLDDPQNKSLQPTNRRSVLRCPFVASAEVTELCSGAVLSARTSELGLGGCFIDALNSFPEGTMVRLRILRDQGIFETKAKVAYCDPRFGMGVAFIEMTPDQRSLLETWLTEIVSRLRPLS